MELALREFGFDGLFDIKTGKFNAQKVYDEEKSEEKPIFMQLNDGNE